MDIGPVIRKYRKALGLTQEELAGRLGVSAPAVNKWEKGKSLPDIALLSPLARLLGISLDELLGHQEELSDAEANALVEEGLAKIEAEGYDEAYLWMVKQVQTYPTSWRLILWLAQLFSAKDEADDGVDAAGRRDFFVGCYEQVLANGDHELKEQAAQALFYHYYAQDNYEEAEAYLAYFPEKSAERKRHQGMIYHRTQRIEEARRVFEELLYSGYQESSLCFQQLYLMALEEEDWDFAERMSQKLAALAQVYEMGRYHEVSAGLELATIRRDEGETLRIVGELLANVESLSGFMKSRLYAHMDLQAPADDDFYQKIRDDILTGFRDEGAYAYMVDNPAWQALHDKWTK